VKARTHKASLVWPVALITIAVVAAIAPISSTLVERAYSRGFYPVVQRGLTSASNVTSIALLDIAAALVLALVVVRGVRIVRTSGLRRVPLPLTIFLLKIIAIVYLLFLAIWGLNYRRVPLEEKLDFEPSQVHQAAALSLAGEAVARANQLYDAAHRTSFDRGQLAQSFSVAERTLHVGSRTIPGLPKRSLLGLYFRAAAIDGMTDPIFLEVILNPDLLSVELPEVLAHEWSHLAGYADESEANFLAWLTCLRGDALGQYSGWLSAYRRALNVLPREARTRVPGLATGPRSDLEAIFARYRRSSPAVREAARDAYDSYLKANRIREGIDNYDAVIRLMLGTSLGRTR
jgi:uncharacterized protein DUF3810